MEKIMMDRRLALRLLNEKSCKVKLDRQFFNSDVYTTKAKHGVNGNLIFINNVGWQDITVITEIEYTNRFGCTSFMEVDWR